MYKLLCAMQQCHGKETGLNFSSILSFEGVAESDAESDKSVSVLCHDA